MARAAARASPFPRPGDRDIIRGGFCRIWRDLAVISGTPGNGPRTLQFGRRCHHSAPFFAESLKIVLPRRSGRWVFCEKSKICPKMGAERAKTDSAATIPNRSSRRTYLLASWGHATGLGAQRRDRGKTRKNRKFDRQLRQIPHLLKARK